MNEWYENLTWTKEDEEKFYLRLNKTRQQKDYYLTRQANILMIQKDKKLQNAGLILAEKIFNEFADSFYIRPVFVNVAKIYAKRKNFIYATKFFTQAVENEIKIPNVVDYSYIEFGKFVVENKIKNAYDEIIKYLLYFRKADSYFDSRFLPNYETSKILAKIYKRKKNKEKAIYFKQLAVESKKKLDEITNQSISKLDSVYWHYEADEFPKELKMRNAATHIGMFIKWCVTNNFFKENSETKKLQTGMETGAQFLLNNFDGKFHIDYLVDECAEFARNYYEESNFTKKFNSYLKDYDNLFSHQFETIYHVEDSNKNYEVVRNVIDKRFEEWKKFKN